MYCGVVSTTNIPPLLYHVAAMSDLMGPTTLPASGDTLLNLSRTPCHCRLFRVYRPRPVCPYHSSDPRSSFGIGSIDIEPKDFCWETEDMNTSLLPDIMGVLMWSLELLQPFCHHEGSLLMNAANTAEGKAQRWKETNSLKTSLRCQITPSPALSSCQITPDLWTFQGHEQVFPCSISVNYS